MLSLVTAPAAEPFLAAEAKTWLKVTGSGDDTPITELISVARQMVENYTGRKLISQTWDLWLDRIPHVGGEPQWEGVREGALSELIRGARYLSLITGPVSSVSYFKYYDTSGTVQTVDTAVYDTDLVSVPGRLYLKQGQVWPTGTRDFNAYVVRFVAGYGASGSAIPEALRSAMKQLIAYLYENRGDALESNEEMPKAFHRLFRPYQILGFP